MERLQPEPSCLEPHCPGPPKASPQASAKSPARSPSSGGNDEIQQLRNELQLCHGKIKGYEILGHLFQESRQECTHYKLQNEELMKKIENLTTSHLSASLRALDKPSSARHTVATADSAEGRNVSYVVNNTSQQQMQTEQGRGFNLTEVCVKTPATARQGSKSGSSSGSSSPSFIQISESGMMSPASFSLRNKSPELSSVSSTELSAQMSADMTAEINQITEQMKKIGQSGSSYPTPDLSADLIRAGVHVLKLQKQNRVQQVLMEKMTAEIAGLKADNGEKQQLIQQLQKECKMLNDMVKQMEASRDKAIQEAQTKILATATADPDDNFAEPSSAEWVEVEKRQSSEAANELTEGAGIDHEHVVATSLVEMELKRRIEKLSTTIAELVAVNQNWDEHCRDIEAKNSEEMVILQDRLTQLQNVVDEREQSDQKRQQEFDSLLLSCKQQREAEEMAKEQALDQLHRERQLRTEAELKCMELSRKTVELEAQLMEFQNYQQVRPTRYGSPIQHHGQPMTTREQELCSQLVILQEQINVFKEDFDQERSDREAARSRMELMRNQLADANSQVNVVNTKMARANAELKATKSENEQWRQRFQKLTADLDALRRHAGPVPHTPSQQFLLPSVSQPRPQSGLPLPQAVIRRPSWACLKCTFKNSGSATKCTMCGTVKHRDVYQTNVPVGGRTAAGLQEYSLYPPYAPLVSRSRLETDETDNKQ